MTLDPPLPAPPLRVFARPKGQRKAFWFVKNPDCRIFYRATLAFYPEEPADLTVIDHPCNDAQAVELIRAAHAGQRSTN